MVKTASTMKPLATKAPDFSLINVDGRTVGLSDFEDARPTWWCSCATIARS